MPRAKHHVQALVKSMPAYWVHTCFGRGSAPYFFFWPRLDDVLLQPLTVVGVVLGAVWVHKALVMTMSTKSAERGAARQLMYLCETKSSRARRWLVRTARSTAF